MSIQNFIARNLAQTCVYWPPTGNDGQGGKTFDFAIELACRWEDIKQVVTDAKGAEITSRALVFLAVDVQEEGMLYLGTLDDLYDITDSELSSPASIEGTFVIKRFQKEPALNSTIEFLRKAYLTPSLSFGSM